MTTFSDRLGVALTTAGSPSEGEKIARALVEERLAACVNVLRGAVSIYRWKNGVSTDEETLLVIKTTRERFPAVWRRIRELHSYEMPEAVLLPALDVEPEYGRWVEDSVSETGPA